MRQTEQDNTTLSRELQDLENHLRPSQRHEPKQQLVRYLLKLCLTPLSSNNEQGKIVITTTYDLLAEGIQTPLKTVASLMAELQNDEVITLAGRNIILKNYQTLEAIAQQQTN